MYKRQVWQRLAEQVLTEAISPNGIRVAPEEAREWLAALTDSAVAIGQAAEAAVERDGGPDSA